MLPPASLPERCLGVPESGRNADLKGTGCPHAGATSRSLDSIPLFACDCSKPLLGWQRRPGGEVDSMGKQESRIGRLPFAGSALERIMVYSRASHGIPWLPLAACGAYMVLLLSHFPRLIAETNANSDAAWAQVVSLMPGTGDEGDLIKVGR